MITADQRLTKIRMALIGIALLVVLILALRARGVSQQGATPKTPGISTSSDAQAGAHPTPGDTQPMTPPELPGAKEADVKSIDSIIAAIYDVISGRRATAIGTAFAHCLFRKRG